MKFNKVILLALPFLLCGCSPTVKKQKLEDSFFDGLSCTCWHSKNITIWIYGNGNNSVAKIHETHPGRVSDSFKAMIDKETQTIRSLDGEDVLYKLYSPYLERYDFTAECLYEERDIDLYQHFNGGKVELENLDLCNLNSAVLHIGEDDVICDMIRSEERTNRWYSNTTDKLYGMYKGEEICIDFNYSKEVSIRYKENDVKGSCTYDFNGVTLGFSTALLFGDKTVSLAY